MARGVDDIDHIIPVPERTVLGGYGDAAFPFQIHGVHKPFGHGLVVSEHAALPKKLVDKGGLAVIDMGNDRYISDQLLVHNITKI